MPAPHAPRPYPYPSGKSVVEDRFLVWGHPARQDATITRLIRAIPARSIPLHTRGPRQGRSLALQETTESLHPPGGRCSVTAAGRQRRPPHTSATRRQGRSLALQIQRTLEGGPPLPPQDDENRDPQFNRANAIR